MENTKLILNQQMPDNNKRNGISNSEEGREKISQKRLDIRTACMRTAENLEPG